MMGSMFGAYAPPQGGGMFGQQQQSPLLQMLGGGGGGMNPQLLQMAQQLMAAGGPSRTPLSLPPMGMGQQPAMPGLGRPDPSAVIAPPFGGYTNPTPIPQGDPLRGLIDQILRGGPPASGGMFR